MRRFFVIWLLCFPLLVKADEIRFSLSVSATRISMQDFLQVQYLVEHTTRVTSFIPPAFKHFQVVEGPSQTTGYNMENGQLKEYVSFSYLLRPGKEGKWIIPPATARVDGKNYKSNAVEVVVTKSAVAAASENVLMAAEELMLSPGEKLESKIRNNMFVRLEVERKSVMVGEPVVATFKLFTRLRSESRVTKRPSFNGFSVYDMANPDNLESSKEEFHGRSFNVYLLRKVQLYPLQAGTFELEAMEVTNELQFIRAEALDAGYSPNELLRELATGVNNSGAIVNHTVALETVPVSIVVKPLPLMTDSGVTGAVGHFSVRSFVEASEIHADDLVNLQIHVAGKGNFPMITTPQVNWPQGVDVFEASAVDRFNKFVSPLSGSKIFTVPFTVKKEGSMVIPSIQLPYYDVVAGKYLSTQTEPINLQVLPSKPVSGNAPATRQEKPADTWKYILTILGLGVVFGGIYILLKRGRSQANAIDTRQDIGLATEVVTPVKDPLDEIRQAFERRDVRAFYSQLSKVINQCMMNKFKVDGQGQWEEMLLEKGVEPMMVSEIKSLKQDAELAMYTPFVQEGKMVEDLARIERIVC